MKPMWLILTMAVCSVTVLAAPVPKLKKKDYGPVTEEQKDIVKKRFKELMLGLHLYNDTYGTLPTDSFDKEGKPLLSWRVHLLPSMNQFELYEKFKLDEPWDSKHNLGLSKGLPDIYAPVRVETDELGYTFVQGFSGDDTVFSSNRKKPKLSVQKIRDGSSNTVGLIEAGTPVLWSKPGDIPFDPKKDLPELGGQLDGDFHIAWCDGSVRFVSAKKLNTKEFVKAITTSGREVFDKKEAFGKD